MGQPRRIHTEQEKNDTYAKNRVRDQVSSSTGDVIYDSH
jgi:hypothetical protein